MPATATIVIPARNAAATIQRAVSSALAQDGCPIVLVDDFSTDNTVAVAAQTAGSRLRVITPSRHVSLGLTRQTGLDAVETPFGVWLDADDELLPGRVSRLVAALENNDADLASDTIELYDGASSQFLKRLTIPRFLIDHSRPPARLFERNYIQGVGCMGFRTAFAKQIAYDAGFHGAEDMDFALRSVERGGRFTFVDAPGYRLYAYPSSMSRRRDNQQAMYSRCLQKHRYDTVRTLLERAGHNDRISAWALASMALFRGDPLRAMEFVSVAESLMTHPDEVLEPNGPCPMPEAWRAAFLRGSAMLSMESWNNAAFWLNQAERIRPTAEGANNLGVAMARLGRSRDARAWFDQSLTTFPNYSDAHANRTASAPSRITLLPLRRENTREDYA